jgi:hypothetical protein
LFSFSFRGARGWAVFFITWVLKKRFFFHFQDRIAASWAPQLHMSSDGVMPQVLSTFFSSLSPPTFGTFLIKRFGNIFFFPSLCGDFVECGSSWSQEQIWKCAQARFFGGTGVWTQGLKLAKQTFDPQLQSVLLWSFGDGRGSWTVCQGWLGTRILPSS